MSDKINVLISEEDVEKRIQEIGTAISKEYEGKCVHLICVLKGGVFFACELAKRITVPVTMDFMSVSSYGDDTKSSGVVKIVKDLDQPLEGNAGMNLHLAKPVNMEVLLEALHRLKKDNQKKTGRQEEEK